MDTKTLQVPDEWKDKIATIESDRSADVAEPVDDNIDSANIDNAGDVVDTSSGGDEDSVVSGDSDVSDDNGDLVDERGEGSDDSGQSSKEPVFKDDVIPGIKGEVFAQLPEVAQEAIGRYYESVVSLKKEHEAVVAKMKGVEDKLSDPIIKERLAMLERGQKEYVVRGINASEKADLLNHVIGIAPELEKETASTIVESISKFMEVVSKEMAADLVRNNASENEKQARENAVMSKGKQTILEMLRMNKEFAVNETDLDKIVDPKTGLNESHPEAGTFKKAGMAAYELLAKKGFTYQQIADLGAQTLYATVASSLGWPVAMNTEKRDKAIQLSERKRVLAAFMSNGGADMAGAMASRVGPRNPGINYGAILNGDTAEYERAITVNGRKSPERIRSVGEKLEQLRAKKQKNN